MSSKLFEFDLEDGLVLAIRPTETPKGSLDTAIKLEVKKVGPLATVNCECVLKTEGGTAVGVDISIANSEEMKANPNE